MIFVPLTQGKFAVIDECDADLILPLSWVCSPASRPIGKFYAMRSEGDRTLYMHRLILGEPVNLTVDHADGDGLNNRRENLRIATISQNNANRPYAGSSGGYRGVYFERDKYRASICVNRRKINLGIFLSPTEAAAAYDAAAIKYYGEFARPNFKIGETS